MKKIQKFSSAITAMILVSAILFSSCKKDYDQPPVQTDPAIVANTTLKDLKARHNSTAGSYELITTDVIISGVVVADDRSGNLYKQIFIEDSTGGLEIALDANSLYGTFPVGRRVFIKCNGLTLTDYHNTMLLGVKTFINGVQNVDGIPSSLIGKYVIGGTLNNPVVPHVVTSADLAAGLTATSGWQNPWIGRLIQLNDYEFRSADTAKTYGDTSYYKNSLDRYINMGCAAGSALDVDVRSSGYANFAGFKTPKGHGSIIGIFAPYGSTRQIIIRDTTDVRFNDTRCGVIVGTALLNESFETQTANTNINIAGWVNAAEAGGKLWDAKAFSGNLYASATAFGTNITSVKSWLVTKSINLGTYTNKVLTFKTNQGFTGTGNALAAPLTILVSTNYTGGPTPWTSTWTDITSMATLSPGSPTGYPASFTQSGNISLNAYSGTIYIAFKYDGADPAGTASDKTSTWEVDDVVVTGN